jgi:hypothetical protein
MREGPSEATTCDSYWQNIKILVGRQATLCLPFFRDLQKAFLICRKHDTPQTYFSLRSTVRLSIILSDTPPPAPHSPHTNRAGFSLSASRSRLVLIKKNRHIQSVNLYLWYKEDNDPWLGNVALGYQFCKNITFILYIVYNVRYNNICYTVKREGPSGTTTWIATEKI